MAEPSTNEVVFGIHAVLELIAAQPARIRHLHLLPTQSSKGLRKIATRAKEQGLLIKRTPKDQLNRLAPAATHQGVVAVVDPVAYLSLGELLERFPAEHEPFFVVLDEIEDPHNLGAIIRSAHALGAQAVVIPKRRAAGISGFVAKAAAGSLAHVAIARVTNLAQTIVALNDSGFMTVATVTDSGAPPWKMDWQRPLALVVGSEHKGVRRLVKERCTHTACIPLTDQAQSLNASVAAGVMLYEIFRAGRQ